MENNICIALDCGATLEILPIGTRFQVVEVIGDQDSWYGKQKTRTVGNLHNTIWGAIEEVRRYDLNVELGRITQCSEFDQQQNQRIF